MGRKSGVEARRYSGVMVTIATTAVALSVAVMVITLSIIMGFRVEVYNRFTSLSGDLIVAPTSGVNPASTASILYDDELPRLVAEEAERLGFVIQSIAPYAYRSAVVRTADGVEGIVLKGVDSLYDLSIMRGGLVEGVLPEVNSEIDGRNVVVAKKLADQLSLDIASRVELLVASEDGALKRDLYRLGAIYEGGLGQMERSLIFANIRHVQSLNGWDDSRISGYEISIDWRRSKAGMGSVDELVSSVNHAILMSCDNESAGAAYDGAAIYSTRQLYPTIFEWLAALDVNAVVVITIMSIVAMFNIITAMLIMVLESSEMIGILKSMGMNNGSLARIFALRSLSVTLRGLLLGNGVALVLLLAQRYFDIITLDEGSYILSSVPVELSVGWLLLLNGAVVAVIALAIALPTRIVSRIEPSKAIKFQ